MPELPDVELYVSRLKEIVLGQPLEKIQLVSMFLLRTVTPPPSDLVGRKVSDIFRMGKRVVFAFEGADDFLVIHLMIAGRFLWRPVGSKLPGKLALAAYDFPNGRLILTEAGSKKRSSMHVVRGREALEELNPGGLEPLTSTLEQFGGALKSENRTVKRALTNPRMFSGIGNTFSDEILWAAKLSPFKLTQSLSDEEVARLRKATIETLTHWTEVLKSEFRDKFPGSGDVTAFRPDYAVHGKFGMPCPVCGHKVQRVAYAENEMNYCAQCQNEGRMLADRSLSRLLKSDWPKTIQEMEGL